MRGGRVTLILFRLFLIIGMSKELILKPTTILLCRRLRIVGVMDAKYLPS